MSKVWAGIVGALLSLGLIVAPSLVNSTVSAQAAVANSLPAYSDIPLCFSGTLGPQYPTMPLSQVSSLSMNFRPLSSSTTNYFKAPGGQTVFTSMIPCRASGSTQFLPKYSAMLALWSSSPVNVFMSIGGGTENYGRVAVFGAQFTSKGLEGYTRRPLGSSTRGPQLTGDPDVYSKMSLTPDSAILTGFSSVEPFPVDPVFQIVGPFASLSYDVCYVVGFRDMRSGSMTTTSNAESSTYGNCEATDPANSKKIRGEFSLWSGAGSSPPSLIPPDMIGPPVVTPEEYFNPDGSIPEKYIDRKPIYENFDSTCPSIFTNPGGFLGCLFIPDGFDADRKLQYAISQSAVFKDLKLLTTLPGYVVPSCGTMTFGVVPGQLFGTVNQTTTVNTCNFQAPYWAKEIAQALIAIALVWIIYYQLLCMLGVAGDFRSSKK